MMLYTDWSYIGITSTTATATTTQTTTTTQATTTGTGTTTSATSTPTSSGGCSGIPAWSSSAAYVGGSEVTYNGQEWQAKWWTEDEIPNANSSVWVLVGKCIKT